MPRNRRRKPSLIDYASTAGLAVVFVVLLWGRPLSEFARDYWPLIALGAAVGGYVIYRFLRWNRRRDLIRNQTLGDFLVLSPAAFEEAVGRLLRAQGYRDVRRVGRSGDLNADLVAIHPDGTRLVVQCKRYAPGQLVGSRDMQAFLGMTVLHHVARGMFVTTSEYTQPALDLARQHGIVTVDGEALVRMAITVTSSNQPSPNGRRDSPGPVGATKPEGQPEAEGDV